MPLKEVERRIEMLEGVIKTIEHNIFEGIVELSVIIPLSGGPEKFFLRGVLPLSGKDLTPKQLRKQQAREEKEQAKQDKEYTDRLEKVLKSVRLGAIEFGYIADVAKASKLLSQCSRPPESEVEF